MKAQDVGMPSAETVRIADLVTHQDGTVVSRTVLKASGGTVTLFAFAAGQGLSEHTAPFHALVQVLEGRAALTVGGRRLEAAAGDSVLLPAGVPHAVDAPVPFKMLLVMVREI